MQTRKHSSKPPEWSNWKGRLCEELAIDYIREIFIPELNEKEKWQHMISFDQNRFTERERRVDEPYST